MGDKVVAEVSSRPEHKVQDTLRQTGLLEYFDELWGGIETPTVERAPRGVHRAVHVGDRRFGHVRDELTGRGVRVFERAAAGSVEPAAVDEVLEHWRRHVG